MRAFLLSLPNKVIALFIILITITAAFIIAKITSLFFDFHQLAANTDLTSAIFQVMGTVYAILLTFTLWGVWQNYTSADNSVQNEAYALMDLVHVIESSPNFKKIDIRNQALAYAKRVVNDEWSLLRSISTETANARQQAQTGCLELVKVVQDIVPTGEKENVIYSQTLTLVNTWLDARRTRLLIARGNSAKALWPLLLTGAAVLFAFHGLFVAKTWGIWASLLFGFSLVIGLTFYLIFELDSPFSGPISIGSEPFDMIIGTLSKR